MKKTVIAATVAHNMSYLGYVPSKELMDVMISDEKVSQKINEHIITTINYMQMDPTHLQILFSPISPVTVYR